jgi:hypothetical protein
MSATQTKTTKNKATHSGSCQACGAQQKLPGGVLAKHGYTTKWGFFSGTCQGSGYKAFEVSCDLIERFIEIVQQKRAAAIEFRDSLLAPATEAKGWMRLYRTGNYVTPSGYYWAECEMEMKAEAVGAPVARFLNPENNRWEGLYQRSISPAWDADRNDILTWVAVCNKRRAAAMDEDIAKMDEYIAWQTNRVATWKPGALTPVGA